MFLPQKLQKANLSNDSSSDYSFFAKKYMKSIVKVKKNIKNHKNDIDFDNKLDQNLYHTQTNENNLMNPTLKNEIFKWLIFF